MLSTNWTWTLLSATLAVAFAAVGLGMTSLYPGAAPLVTMALLVGSLAATAGAFTMLALRVRRLEMENMGLIEEVSQEFQRVHDKFDVFSDALDAPRTLNPEEADANTPMRRVMIK